MNFQTNGEQKVSLTITGWWKSCETPAVNRLTGSGRPEMLHWKCWFGQRSGVHTHTNTKNYKHKNCD